MLCERCNKNEATIQLVKDTDNGKESIMLCDKCAIEIMNSSLEDEITLEDFLMDLNSYIEATEDLLEIDEEKCKVCGMEYCDFEDTRLLGCENCYDSFSENICEYFRWKQFSKKHVGKVPKSLNLYFQGSDILSLEEELKLNIINEEYEKAIITKEKIHDLKKIMEGDISNDSMDKSSKE